MGRDDRARDERKDASFQDAGHGVCMDVTRPARCGHAEAILGEGKTDEQIVAAVDALVARGQPALVTRCGGERASGLRLHLAPMGLEYDELAGCWHSTLHEPDADAVLVSVVSAGSSDRPVAAEAAATMRLHGLRVTQCEDVGVAGLDRLLARMDSIRAADIVVVVAGMDAALASVVAGQVAAPVVAVPTSVGYGSSFEGLSALLGMLNACSAGVVVVNIDNGFGAGIAAVRLAGALRRGSERGVQTP